jgi:hypothetical protein
MASLQWNEHIRIVVSEMSWKQQIACSAEFVAWMQAESTKQDQLARQVTIITMLILHSRVRVYRDDELLAAGAHDLGDGVTLTLPLTKESLEDLPASLAGFLVKAAQEENPQTITNFMRGLTETIALKSAT